MFVLCAFFVAVALGDVTFAVSNVARESSPLPRRIDGPLGVHESRLIAVSATPFPRVTEPEPEQRSTSPCYPLMGDMGSVFGVIKAAALAFAHHLPLALKPDHFWELILQGVALHVSRDPDGMKHVFASKHYLESGEKTKIVLAVDAFDESAFEMLSQLVRENMADRAVYDMIIANFSTTTELDRIVQHVTLLDATKSYFTLEIMTMCGIPQITLQGCFGDWERLQTQTRYLLEKVGMNWWYEEMRPYLQLMVDSFDETSNKTLWESFFKYHSQSGAEKVDGFVMAFHPYVGNDLVRNPWFDQKEITDWYDRGVANVRIPLPQGKVGIKLDNKSTHVYAGFTAPGQMADGTITPMLAWALVADETLDE